MISSLPLESRNVYQFVKKQLALILSAVGPCPVSAMLTALEIPLVVGSLPAQGKSFQLQGVCKGFPEAPVCPYHNNLNQCVPDKIVHGIKCWEGGGAGPGGS